MSDIDAQLKALQLQREQLEVERLLAQKRFRQSLMSFPLKFVAKASHFIGNLWEISWGFVRGHENILRKVFLVIVVCTLTVFGFLLWREQRLAAEQEQMRIKIESAVANACADDLAAEKICEEKKLNASSDPIDYIGCFNQTSSTRLCVAKARQEAYLSFTSQR